MPPDYSFLSNPASANYQSPNLLGMAGQAMTLGSMAQQQQLQSIQIQQQQALMNAYSDPRYGQAMQDIMQTGGRQGGWQFLQQLASENSPAAPQLLSSGMALLEKQSALSLN